MSVILALFCIAIYKLLDELQDESVNSFWKKPFIGLPLRFLNKRMPSWYSKVDFPDWGWARKWKWDFIDGQWIHVQANKKPWWYLWLWKPKYQERFPLSYTVLVWLTDGEHLFQFIKDLFIGVAFYAITGSWVIGLAGWLTTYAVGLVKELRKP